MIFHPRNATHIVAAAVSHSPTFPVPFAIDGTVMVLNRIQAEWKQLDGSPWRLDLVTVWGAASNGSGIRVDYFPDNPTKRPPAELSEWIATTNPGMAPSSPTDAKVLTGQLARDLPRALSRWTDPTKTRELAATLVEMGWHR